MTHPSDLEGLPDDLGPPSNASEMEVMRPRVVDLSESLDPAPARLPVAPEGRSLKPLVVVAVVGILVAGVVAIGMAVAVAGGAAAFLL